MVTGAMGNTIILRILLVVTVSREGDEGGRWHNIYNSEFFWRNLFEMFKLWLMWGGAGGWGN